jgi:hypothetical protein
MCSSLTAVAGSPDNLTLHPVDALDPRDRDTMPGIPMTAPAR